MPGPLPDSLRQAIGNDLQPVRPLPPAWMRTLFAVAVTAVCLGIVAVIFKLSLRSDMESSQVFVTSSVKRTHRVHLMQRSAS